MDGWYVLFLSNFLDILSLFTNEHLLVKEIPWSYCLSFLLWQMWFMLGLFKATMCYSLDLALPTDLFYTSRYKLTPALNFWALPALPSDKLHRKVKFQEWVWGQVGSGEAAHGTVLPIKHLLPSVKVVCFSMVDVGLLSLTQGNTP